MSLRWGYDKDKVCAWKTQRLWGCDRKVVVQSFMGSCFPIYRHLSLYTGRLPPKRGSILLWAFHHRLVTKDSAHIECQDVLLEPIPYVYAFVAEGHMLITTLIDLICQKWIKIVIFVLRYVHIVMLGMPPGNLDVHYEVSSSYRYIIYIDIYI